MIRSLSAKTIALIVFGITVACIALVSSTASDEESDPDDISHGLGNHITWQTLEEGLTLAKETNKPLMLIIHKSWCGACRSLIPKLRESKEMAKLSTKFIMVNTQDNDEPTEDTYRPDGGYIPRILFFNPEGSFQEDVINEDGNPKYKYYYYDAASVLNSMSKVSKLFSAETSKIDQNEDSEGIANSNQTQTPGSQKSEL